eukprot:scaffold13607_cov117-Skeletonema_dohrnii-CCMP3373.AAC.3
MRHTPSSGPFPSSSMYLRRQPLYALPLMQEPWAWHHSISQARQESIIQETIMDYLAVDLLQVSLLIYLPARTLNNTRQSNRSRKCLSSLSFRRSYQAQDAGVDLVHYRQKLQPSKPTTDKVAAAIPISPLLRCVDSKLHLQFSIGLESMSIQVLVLSVGSYLHHLSLVKAFTMRLGIAISKETCWFHHTGKISPQTNGGYDSGVSAWSAVRQMRRPAAY